MSRNRARRVAVRRARREEKRRKRLTSRHFFGVGFAKFIFVLFMGTFGALALVNSANAFFSTLGAGSGSVSVSTLNPATSVVATQPVSTVTTVDVSWTAPTEPSGIVLDGYYVQRYLGSTPSPACGTSPTSLISSLTCNDTSVAPDTYTYTVTAVFRSWTAESLPSAPVTIGAPVLTSFTLTPSNSSPNAGAAITVGITALDQFGNVDVGYTGPECLTFSGPANSPDGNAPIYPPPGSCSSGSEVTFLNGVATGTDAAGMTLFDAQTVTLTATDNPTSVDGTTILNVLSGPISTFDVANPGNQTVLRLWMVTVTSYPATRVRRFWTSLDRPTLPMAQRQRIRRRSLSLVASETCRTSRCSTLKRRRSPPRSQ
jgi:hypothetical protein